MASDPCPTCGLRRFPDIKPEKRASAPPRRPAKRPECDAPENAREAKVLLRKLSEECREARRRWHAAREAAPGEAAAVSLHMTSYCAGDLEAGRIGVLTFSMWQAEEKLQDAAALWRAILAVREAMPVAARWSLRDLEAWASWPTAVS